jgi:hypothetical protein
MDLDPAVIAALESAPAESVPEEASAAAETPVEASEATAPPETIPEPKRPPLEAAKGLRDRAAKEREFRAYEARLKQERAELEQHKAMVAEAQELVRLSKEDPLAWLEKTGHSFERMGTDLAMGKKATVVDKLSAELTQLKQQIAEQNAREQQIAIEEEYEDTREDIQGYLIRNSERYGYTAASGMHDMVLQAAQSHFEETGEIDLDGAAAKVEAYLESIVERVKTSGKYQKRAPSSVMETAPKTLTHKNSSQVKKRESSALTEEERLANAISLL